MTDYLDSLRQELVAASGRTTRPSAVTARRGRWWRRSPRALAVALAALLVSATALAATTTPWQPLFGDPNSPQPRVTGAAPPAEQLALLGVLRRPQTSEDRGPTTQRALRYFGTTTQGVYTNYIRRLPPGEGALAATLLPARSWQSPGFSKNGVLCLFVAEAQADEGGAKACYTTADIEQGTAGGSLGSVSFGLVPDGVAQIQFHYPSGTQSVRVQDNFFEYRAPGTSSSGRIPPAPPQATSWLDADGNPTRSQPGSR